MNTIIACNTRLVDRSVKITQLTVEINIVLACCRSNLLLLSPKREGEAGGYKFPRSSLVDLSSCGHRTRENTFHNIP